MKACLHLAVWSAIVCAGAGCRAEEGEPLGEDATSSSEVGDGDGEAGDGDGEAGDGDGEVGDGDGEAGDGDGDPGDGECATWCPAPGTSWQWQLVGEIDTSVEVEVYDIDLFDVPAATIEALHADGRAVICYFSAGSHEDWRPDAADFPPAALGEPLDGWPGERWLDIRDLAIRPLMQARLDLASSKGCDAVEPDNVDAYQNASGFPLTPEDQLDYNAFLAEEAHLRGLSIGLKNDLGQVEALVESFDWALNEECLSWDECQELAPFLDAGKAVFHVEYVDDVGQGEAAAEQLCPQVPEGFSSMIKLWELDPWRIACP